MKRYAFAALALTAAFGLVACGDESTTNNYTTTEIEDIVSKKLPDCDKELKGKIYFVTDKAELQICMDGEWITTNGEQGEQGEQGIQGEQGEKGDAGASCKAKSVKNKAGDKIGYKIVCDGDSVGVVLNGEKGEKGIQGEKGDAGVSCKMTPIKDKGDTAAMVICQKDTVYLLNGKDAEVGGSGTGTGTGTIEDHQTTLTEGSMPNGLVIIGNQVWAGQNVNDATKGGACYNNSESNCEIFGRLYSWAEAMGLDTSYNSILSEEADDLNFRGICPEGFHIPTGTDWANLDNAVAASAKADSIRAARNSGEWDRYSSLLLRGTNYNADGKAIWAANAETVPGMDVFGFMVVGSGEGTLSVSTEYNDATGQDELVAEYDDFDYLKNHAEFWTVNQHSETYAYHTQFTGNRDDMWLELNDEKHHLYSVRCIMNMSAQDYMKTDEYKALFTASK